MHAVNVTSLIMRLYQIREITKYGNGATENRNRDSTEKEIQIDYVTMLTQVECQRLADLHKQLA